MTEESRKTFNSTLALYREARHNAADIIHASIGDTIDMLGYAVSVADFVAEYYPDGLPAETPEPGIKDMRLNICELQKAVRELAERASRHERYKASICTKCGLTAKNNCDDTDCDYHGCGSRVELCKRLRKVEKNIRATMKLLFVNMGDICALCGLDYKEIKESIKNEQQ